MNFKPRRGPAPGNAPARVLIVDDATTVRLYYRHLLEVEGYRVEEAINGIEGLEKAFRRPGFDLVVADVNMPMLDGFAFLQALRAEPRTVCLPALVTSTQSGPHDREAAFQAGADDYLVKPVLGDLFALHVAALLGRAPR
jgi:two-component system chemotaxis response regulator CheY